MTAFGGRSGTVVMIGLLALALAGPRHANAQCDPPAIHYIYDENSRLIAVIDLKSNPPAAGGNVAIYNYDPAGNLTSITRQSSLLAVLAFSPGCGLTPADGQPGTTVTIRGTGFTETSTVAFNGTPATTVMFHNGTTLTAEVPANAQTGPITVGTSMPSSKSFKVNECKVPKITSISPTIGPAGTAVVINGENFDPAPGNSRVVFNSAPALNGAVASTRIDTTVPPAATSGKIFVATPFGRGASPVDFFVPPEPYTVAQVYVPPVSRMQFEGSINVTVLDGKHTLILFDAVQGKRVFGHFTNDQLPGFVSFAIYTPDGQPVSFPPDSPGRLNHTGTYTAAVGQLNGSGGGTITMTLYDVPDDPIYYATPAAPRVQVVTPKYGMNATIYFDGVAGQRHAIRKNELDMYSGFTYLDPLYDPDGLPMFGNVNASFTEPFVLPKTGRYAILFNPNGLATGSEFVTQYFDVDLDLSTSIQFSVETDAPNFEAGQNHNLLFSTTTADQAVTIRVVSNPFTFGPEGCLSVQLRGPAPSTALIYDDASLCQATLTLPQQVLQVPGAYTVVVNPKLWATGTPRMVVTSP